MSAYKAIHYLLAHDSTVSGLVGSRIYPVTVPQRSSDDEVMYPCLVIGIISEIPLTMVGMRQARSSRRACRSPPWQKVSERKKR